MPIQENRKRFLTRLMAAGIPVLGSQPHAIPIVADRTAAFVGWALRGGEGDLPQKYYPELNGVTPLEKGNFRTSGGKDINWYNYTNLTVNASALQDLYQYYEGLSAQARRGSIPNGSGVIQFQTLPNPYKKIGVFFVDGNASDPIWGQDNTPGAVTYTGYNREITLTNIKVKPALDGLELQLFPSIQDNVDFDILVEAAEASFSIISSEQPDSNLAREDFCNSYALALYLKQRNDSYPEYIQKTSVRISVRGGRSFSPIHLSENEYMNRLPLLPPLIKVK